MTTTQEVPAYGLIVGGYRVRFTNWDSGREYFFAVKEEAEDYLSRFRAYGYEGTVETIHLHVREGK